MSAPNVDPRFATDTNFAADGDVWSGDPTKLDPGSGRQAEGFEPDSLPAEWLNWILNRLGAWVYFFTTLLGGLDGTGEWTYQAPKTRILTVPLDAVGAAPGVSFEMYPGVSGVTSRKVLIKTNSGLVSFPLTHVLRDGQTITDLEVIVDPGAARSGSNRMRVDLLYTAPDFYTLSNNPVDPLGVTLSGPQDDTTSNKQLIGGVAIGHVVQRAGTAAREYWITVKGGNDAGTNNDTIYGIQIQVSDPGPRNH